MKKLSAWDIAYHQNDSPIVDDATYDAAKRRALELEEMYPSLARGGASESVGAAVIAQTGTLVPADKALYKAKHLSEMMNE